MEGLLEFKGKVLAVTRQEIPGGDLKWEISQARSVFRYVPWGRPRNMADKERKRYEKE